MFSGFSSSLSLFGGFAYASGLGIAASGNSHRDLGFDSIEKHNPFNITHETPKIAAPDQEKGKNYGFTGKLKYDSFKKSKCYESKLNDVNLEEGTATLFILDGDDGVGTVGDKFSPNSKSCIDISWDKWTRRKDGTWAGVWDSVWTVSDNNKEDVFTSNIHTKNGKLYSEGISYKFEKEGSKWKMKERFTSPSVEVTKINKDKRIVKPNKGELPNGDNYSGFGDPDLNNICVGDECNKFDKSTRSEKRWEFNNQPELCDNNKTKTITDWTFYNSWRNKDGGLFPYNQISPYYKQKWAKVSYQTKGMPPPNNIERYSNLKGCFWEITSDKDNQFEE